MDLHSYIVASFIAASAFFVMVVVVRAYSHKWGIAYLLIVVGFSVYQFRYFTKSLFR